MPTPFMNLDELESLLDSLIMNYELEQGQQLLESQTLCNEAAETRGGQVETSEAGFAWKRMGIPKHIHEHQSSSPFPAELSPARIQWV